MNKKVTLILNVFNLGFCLPGLLSGELFFIFPIFIASIMVFFIGKDLYEIGEFDF